MHNARFNKIANSIKSANLNDFSEGVSPHAFDITAINNFGVSGKVISVAFNQTQSLLALSNDRGEIYIFGNKGIRSIIRNNDRSPITYLKFVKNIFVVTINSFNMLNVFSLYSKKLLADFKIPKRVTYLESDPSLDFIFIGLENGDLMIYDVVNGYMTNSVIPNYQLKKGGAFNGTIRDQSIKSVQIHPRDIGTILVAYSKLVILYSLTEERIKQDFVYELLPGAPGGNFSPKDINSVRYPSVKKAIFHPNGLNLLTLHSDGSLVFWDTNNGTLILARTLFDTDIDKPSRLMTQSQNMNDIEWICEKNPENTSLLISDNHDLIKMDFDTTPKYSLTSYEKMAEFYSNLKNLKIFPINNDNQDRITKVLSLPITSPFFNNNHNPNLILILLSDGSLTFLKYPIGKLISKSSILPTSVSWLNSKVTFMSSLLMPQKSWNEIIEDYNQNNTKGDFYSQFLLKGGYLNKRNSRINNSKFVSLIVTGHYDGSIKIYDTLNFSVIDIDTSVAFNETSQPVLITKLSISPNIMALIASNYNGETIVYKFGVNKNYNPSLTQEDYDLNPSLLNFKNSGRNGDGLVVNAMENMVNYTKFGYLPQIIIKPPITKGVNGLQITCTKVCDIEFAMVAYNDGQFLVVDLRINDIIFRENINSISDKRKNTNSLSYVTSAEFSIAQISEEVRYSSIILMLGTSVGNLISFQIIPSSNTKLKFRLKFLNCMDVNESKIRNIIPIKSTDGSSAIANIKDFSKLSSAIIIPSYTICVSSNNIKLYKALNAKHSSTSYTASSSHGEIVHCDVVYMKENAVVLNVLHSDGEIVILSLAGLAQISKLKLPVRLNRSVCTQGSILPNGEYIIRNDENESIQVNTVAPIPVEDPMLFNKDIKMPARPLFNSLQWARGSKVTTIEELEMVLFKGKIPKTKYITDTRLAIESCGNSSNINHNVGSVEDSSESGNILNSFTSMIGGSGGSKRNTQGSSSTNVNRVSTDKKRSSIVSNKAGGGWGSFNMQNFSKSFNDTFNNLEDKFNDMGNQIAETMNDTVEEGKNSMMKSMVKSKFGM